MADAPPKPRPEKSRPAPADVPHTEIYLGADLYKQLVAAAEAKRVNLETFCRQIVRDAVAPSSPAASDQRGR